MLLHFISRKFFIQYIGVEYLGINGLFSNVLTLLSMADLGLGTAMNVNLYKPIAEKDSKKLAALLNYYRQLYRYLDRNIPYLHLYYVVFVVKNAISYLFVYKGAIVRADQKTYLINRIDTSLGVLSIILQILSIVIFRNYLIYILLDVARVFAHNILVSITADKHYPFIKDRAQLSIEEKKSIFTNISSVFVYKISKTLINGTDNILMSMLVGTVYVGIYSNYHTITHTLDSFLHLLFTSITAGIGNLVATESSKKVYKTFQTMQMVSFWLCSFVCICLLFLTQDFIQLWFGQDLLLDNLTLIAIVINVFFSNCMRPVWSFREGTGMYKHIRYIMFATAIVNLLLSIVLGKFLGLCGILFATSLSKLATYFWYEPNILFRDVFHVKTKKYYLEYLKNLLLIIISGVICAVPVSFVKTSIHGWIIKLVICTLVVNSVYLLRYYKTEEFQIVKEKLLHLYQKKKKNI